MNQYKRKVITDSLFISAGKLFIKLKGIILIPIVIHFVGLAQYGSYIQIIVNRDLIVLLASLALGQGFNRFTSKFKASHIGNISRDYWSVICVSILFSALGAGLLYFISPFISNHILGGTALDELRLSAFLVFTGCLSNQSSKFIAARKYFKLFSFYEVIFNLIPYLGFIIGIYVYSNLFQGMLFFLFGEIAVVLMIMLWIVRRFPLVMPAQKRIIKFIRYSWPLTISEVTGGFLAKVDRYFIGYFLGPAVIGIYNIVYSACSLLDTLSVPFIKYFGVYLPKVWDRGDRNKVINDLKEGFIYYLIISVGCLTGLVLFLKPLVRLIIHKDLNLILNFEWFVLITGLGILSLGATRFFYQVIKYRKQTYLQLQYQLLALSLNCVLNWFLIKSFGIIGASLATFLSYQVVIILCINTLNLKFDLKYLTKVGRIAIASFALVCAFYFIDLKNGFDYIFMGVAGSLIYGCSLFLLRVVRLSDLKERFT